MRQAATFAANNIKKHQETFDNFFKKHETSTETFPRCYFSEYIALRDFFENMLSIFGGAI